MSNAERDETSPFSLHQAFPSKQELADATKIHAAKAGFEFYAHNSQIRQQEIRVPMPKSQGPEVSLAALCLALHNEPRLHHQDSTLAAHVYRHEQINIPKHDIHPCRKDDSAEGRRSSEIQAEGGSARSAAHEGSWAELWTSPSGKKEGDGGFIRQLRWKLRNDCAVLRHLAEYQRQLRSDLGRRLATNMFHRIFISFGASIAGFVSCRPVFGLDGTHLRHSYKGILLMSVALDARGQLFPLAFGVCPVENQDNWEWFLRKLLNALSSYPSRRITWLSDRQKGLINAVAYLRPGEHHAFCLVHLKANFVKRFSDQGLVALL
ncbi:hypothetical protein NCC49_005130 [Naganishia albida]|nr:hypothetical protein NCC49_005130 [Naganishia albida]